MTTHHTEYISKCESNQSVSFTQQTCNLEHVASDFCPGKPDSGFMKKEENVLLFLKDIQNQHYNTLN